MEVELRLDQDEPIYTHRDTISGEVILRSTSPASLSTIVLSLSGIATSRLTKSRRIESHKLFKKSQQVFPSESLLKDPRSPGVTIGSGHHVLRFSMTFPTVIECYKADLRSSRSQIPCADIGYWRNGKSHLLRKTPPTTGHLDSLAEIRYTLSVIVTGRKTIRKTRNIVFHPSSDPVPQQSPFNQECSISASPQFPAKDPPSSFRIDIGLENGPCLLLGSSIPLRINITKLDDLFCNILLSGFQTMLIERTQVRVRGRTESYTCTWIVQTMANMDHPIALADASQDSTVTLTNTIWANNRLPPELTSSFEVCNIKRTYNLNIKLGFLVGNRKLRMIMREFAFPVYVMGASLPLTKSNS